MGFIPMNPVAAIDNLRDRGGKAGGSHLQARKWCGSLSRQRLPGLMTCALKLEAALLRRAGFPSRVACSHRAPWGLHAQRVFGGIGNCYPRRAPPSADHLADRTTVQIAPESAKLIGVRTTRVEKRPMVITVRSGAKATIDPALFNLLQQSRQSSTDLRA